MFTYEEADVFVILDKDKKPWYHGKQIAEILHYKNTRDALCKHVDKKYKMSLADMTSRFATSIKMDVKTTFINNSGLFQLVSRSKKKEAVKLWEFIAEEVLPELFTTGTYTLAPEKSDIERLNKSFYDDNILSDFEGNPVVYFAYVGEYNKQHKMKYEYSTDFKRRDLLEHRKDQII